jgi:hypothetical protein
MENIIEPTMDYDFNNIQLSLPIAQPASTYLTRIFVNNKSLFIQTPKCVTRNGFVKSGKKIYCDLMFSNTDSIFINWIENLENKCRELIYKKGEMWFQNKMEKEDIDVAFTSPLRIFKSGSFYLMRVNVKPVVKIFNDTNNEVTLENITPETNLVSILEIIGIKFTSHNFQIELELKQTMVVSSDPFLDKCLIKTQHTNTNNTNTNNTTDEEKHLAKNTRDINQIVNNILNTHKKPEEVKKEEQVVVVVEDPVKDQVKDPVKEEEEVVVPPIVEVISEPGKPEKVVEVKHVEEMDEFDKAVQNQVLLDQSSQNLNQVSEKDITELHEIDFDLDLDNLESITLKKPNHVYQQLYKDIIEKAKILKTEAKTAYLEAKNLKEQYMLISDSEDSYESDSDSYMDSDNENENENENY